MSTGGAPAVLDADGFVLAGGRSSRMGQDKALLDFFGQPLIERALGILRRAGVTASVAGGSRELAAFATLVPDSRIGPLGGICAGLAAAVEDLAVFLPVDMPLVPPGLLRLMLQHARTTGAKATLASVNGFAQTFPAVLDRSLLAGLQNELRNGNGGCFAAFGAACQESGSRLTVLPVEFLVQARQIMDEDGLRAALWFLNVNRPLDLERAESIVAACRRVC